ncbi:MAG: hypothetical protein ACJASV_002392 [Pseudorhodobacter sp.]|jgi:hypothetical protein
MIQSQFHEALLNPDLPVPAGLIDAEGRPAGRRFSIYRNNVTASLTEVLQKGFPVLQKLLGEEYFKALAVLFLRENPPTSRIMMLYGAAMPSFLAGFPPLAHLPYLPDIARLEQALREAYHAADTAAIDPARLGALAPEAFMAARFTLSPALRVITSDYPVFSIWAANSREGAPAPVMRAETAAILRADYDPEPHLLPAHGADFIAALQAGQSIGAALEPLPEDFDLGATLALLIHSNAITDLIEE